MAFTEIFYKHVTSEWSFSSFTTEDVFRVRKLSDFVKTSGLLFEPKIEICVLTPDGNLTLNQTIKIDVLGSVVQLPKPENWVNQKIGVRLPSAKFASFLLIVEESDQDFDFSVLGKRDVNRIARNTRNILRNTLIADFIRKGEKELVNGNIQKLFDRDLTRISAQIKNTGTDAVKLDFQFSDQFNGFIDLQPNQTYETPNLYIGPIYVKRTGNVSVVVKFCEFLNTEPVAEPPKPSDPRLAILDTMNPLSDNHKNAVKNALAAFDTANLYTRLTGWFPFVGETQANCSINLIDQAWNIINWQGNGATFDKNGMSKLGNNTARAFLDPAYFINKISAGKNFSFFFSGTVIHGYFLLQWYNNGLHLYTYQGYPRAIGVGAFTGPIEFQALNNFTFPDPWTGFLGVTSEVYNSGQQVAIKAHFDGNLIADSNGWNKGQLSTNFPIVLFANNNNVSGARCLCNGLYIFVHDGPFTAQDIANLTAINAEFQATARQ